MASVTLLQHIALTATFDPAVTPQAFSDKYNPTRPFFTGTNP
jgi:hypothetical protein